MTRLAGIIVNRESHPAYRRGWERFHDGDPRPIYDMNRNSQIAELEIEGWDRAKEDMKNG